MDPGMKILRFHAPSEELDYNFVMDCLKSYAFPRTKLTHLLNSESLIRVKKGLYVFGPDFKQSPYSLETLANLIYGPSYISLEWALQFYGLIPERVHEITSVTFKRKQLFETPIGRFSYAHRPLQAYSSGILWKSNSEYQNYLIASPEKALIDLLVIRRGKVRNLPELEEIVFDDFRVEEDDLFKLDVKEIEKINQAYSHSAITLLTKMLKK